MQMDAQLIKAWVEIISSLAWPMITVILVIWAMYLFRKPISAFISGLGHRVTKISVLNVTSKNGDRIKALLSCKAPSIAIVNSKGEFTSMLDRQKLAALVGKNLINQSIN